jgi:hypothetical protein
LQRFVREPRLPGKLANREQMLGLGLVHRCQYGA